MSRSLFFVDKENRNIGIWDIYNNKKRIIHHSTIVNLPVKNKYLKQFKLVNNDNNKIETYNKFNKSWFYV